MRQKNMIGIVAMALVFSGCVSASKYRLLQQQVAYSDAAKQTLTNQVSTLTREKADLAQEAAAREAEIAKLKGTYDDLVGNLKNEINSGQIQVTQLKDKLTLNMVEKILFNSGQADVKESGKKVLDSIAAALKKTQDRDIRVEGYTDNVPLSPRLRSRYPT